MTHIDLSVRCPAWLTDLPDAKVVARRACHAALEAAGPPARALRELCEIGVVLADDDFLRDLNRDLRGRDAPTNVLALPVLAAPERQRIWGLATLSAPLMLGDVVVAHQTVAAEAEATAVSLSDHFAHLLVHGTLHLLGYDHQSDGEASVMERLEVDILAGLGVADPYGPAATAQGARP